MSNLPTPFDDPQFRKAMADAGVVFKPGSSKPFMDSIAPLLAAEGIDLDNLSPDIDLDTLNDAMGRATERHNFELFTPVGAQREQALEILRRFAIAVEAGDLGQAHAILDEVQPEPTADRPAASHLIGVALGLADSWFTDPNLAVSLAGTRIPAWNDRAARAAGRQILLAARNGQAFDSVGAFITSYTGQPTCMGAALVVAGVLASVAEAERSTVAAQAGPMFAVGSSDRPMKAADTADHLALSTAELGALENFAIWLGDRNEIAAPSVDNEVSLLSGLFSVAKGFGLQADNPDDMEDLVDFIMEIDDPDEPGFLGAALMVVDEYLHFRLETDDQQYDDWLVAHAIVEDTLEEAFPSGASEALFEVIEEAEQLDPKQHRAALARVTVVAQVRTLLEWIGKSRPVAQAGGLRRADIAEVAAMLGFNAVGVNKRGLDPSFLPPEQIKPHQPLPIPESFKAMSIRDVPPLNAWWDTLITTELIELTATRVRPGPKAAEWLADKHPPLELADMVTGVFTTQLLIQDLDDTGYYFERETVSLAVLRLLAALRPKQELPAPDGDPMADILDMRALRQLEYLRRLGILKRSRDQYVVPPNLRGAIARGLLVATSMMSLEDSDEDDD